MNGFLKALKEDLLDRRMRLPAAVAVVILIAGIAYAATSSSSTPAEGGVLPSGRTAALPAKPPSALEGASLSEKETTYSSGREPSSPRDPFRYPTATSGTVNASGTVGAGGVSGTSSPPAGGGHGGSPTPSPAPPAPRSQPTTTSTTTTTTNSSSGSSHGSGVAYLRVGRRGAQRRVVVKVGETVVVGGQKLVELVSVKQPSGRKGVALFRLVDLNVVVSGQGHCVPSTTSCAAITVEEGKTFRLSYLGSEGSAITLLVAVRRVAP